MHGMELEFQQQFLAHISQLSMLCLHSRNSHKTRDPAKLLVFPSPAQLPLPSQCCVGAQMQLSLSENCFIFQPLLFNYTFALALVLSVCLSVGGALPLMSVWDLRISRETEQSCEKPLSTYGNGIPITSKWRLIADWRRMCEKKKQAEMRKK